MSDTATLKATATPKHASPERSDFSRLRSDFPTLKSKEVFLDSVASSLTPICVVEAMNDYYFNYRANVHRGTYDLSMQAAEYYERGIANIANFIGADSDEVIMTQNTTSAINKVALSTDFKPGDEIIVSSIEHTSNLLPWIRLTSTVGVKVRCYSPGKEGKFDLEEFEKLFSNKTRLVSLAYISNVLGCIAPVKEISKLCQKHSTLFLIDAAQAAPHIKIDVHDIGCDFMAFSGHKMLGPTGIGVLYMKREHANSMLPAFLGGGTVMTGRCGCPSIDTCGLDYITFNDLPHKWQAGTPPIAEVLGLSRAVQYLDKIGLDNIEHHDRTLTEYAVDQLSQVPGIDIFGPKDVSKRNSIVAFNIGDLAPSTVGDTLYQKFNIAVRAGDHCALAYFKEVQDINESWGSVRASFYIYNTEEDVDALVGAVSHIASHGVDG